MFALFNNSKSFIGFCNEIPPYVSYYKNIENIDLTTHIWQGDYDTGKIIPLEKIKNTEFEIDNSLLRSIKKIYNKEIINLLSLKQLYITSKKLECVDPTFEEMYKSIEPYIISYEKHMEKLKSENMLVTKKEFYEESKKLLGS